jgi:hypothetical protein
MPVRPVGIGRPKADADFEAEVYSKVEVNLTGAQREEVRKRFEDSPVHLAGLGSAFECLSDPASVA